ncbi:MAG: HlyD family secretion protein [Tuberibacillus sp.]
MKSFQRMLILNIIVLIILVGAGFLGYYYYNQSANYIKTDNAAVDGQMITIAAPTSGKLTDWTGEVGKTYDSGESVGTLVGAPEAGSKTPVRTSITFPQKATIVKQSAVPDSFVAAGTPLAQAFNMDNLWITANVDETDINDVEEGQDVDIYVDAYPNMTLEGKVEKIGLTTASTFSLLPSSNSSGNYTKVTQVVPVKISIDDYKGLELKPGLNVTVKIHK